MICDSFSILIGKHPKNVCVNESHLTYANSLISQCGVAQISANSDPPSRICNSPPTQLPLYPLPFCDAISDNPGWVTQIFKPFNNRTVCFYPWWLYLLLFGVHRYNYSFRSPNSWNTGVGPSRFTIVSMQNTEFILCFILADLRAREWDRFLTQGKTTETINLKPWFLSTAMLAPQVTMRVLMKGQKEDNIS